MSAPVLAGRFALFNPTGLPLPAGWDGPVCTLSHQLTDLAPDLVIAADATLGKRTGHPWLGWLREDPDLLRRDRRRLDCLLSHDGFIVDSPAQARFLTDILAATDRAPHILPSDGLAPDRLAGLLAGRPSSLLLGNIITLIYTLMWALRFCFRQ